MDIKEEPQELMMVSNSPQCNYQMVLYLAHACVMHTMHSFCCLPPKQPRAWV